MNLGTRRTTVGNVHVLVVGQGAKAAADEAATLDGVTKVLLAEGPQLAHQLAEEVARGRARAQATGGVPREPHVRIVDTPI